MTNQMKIATGLLAGAAVGAAILFALKSDKDNFLKQKVTDWFCDLLANSKDKLGMIGNLAKENLANAKA